MRHFDSASEILNTEKHLLTYLCVEVLSESKTIPIEIFNLNFTHAMLAVSERLRDHYVFRSEFFGQLVNISNKDICPSGIGSWNEVGCNESKLYPHPTSRDRTMIGRITHYKVQLEPQHFLIERSRFCNVWDRQYWAGTEEGCSFNNQ